jgi:hypothetical protein
VSRGCGVALVEPINIRYGHWPQVVGIPFVPSIEFTFSWMRPRERGNSRLSNRFLEILTQRIADIAEGHATDVPHLRLRLPARERLATSPNT